MSVTRTTIAAAFLGLAVMLCLTVAGVALAVDGAKVFDSGAQLGYDQFDAQIAGDVAVWKATTWDPDSSLWGPERIWAYDLAAGGGSPSAVMLSAARSPFTYQVLPAALYREGKLYVVWQQITRAPPYTDWIADDDVWIWVGTVAADGTLTPDGGFPKPLVTGPGSTSSNDQTYQGAPSIGVSDVGGERHVVVAWTDTRDYGVWSIPDYGEVTAPQIYMLDLSADTGYRDLDYVSSGGPVTAGAAIDLMPAMARGQYTPSVGATGIYWIDLRESLWSPGDDPFLMGAVWRGDLATGAIVSSRVWGEALPTNDNSGPAATAVGVSWVRRGPYDPAHSVGQLMGRPVGGAAALLCPGRQASTPSVYYAEGGTRSVFAFSARHADSATFAEPDIFLFDSASGARVPVCTFQDPDPARETLSVQMDAAVGPLPSGAPTGQRVLWSDNRDNVTGLDDSVARYELRQAFVPSVSIRGGGTISLGGTAKIAGVVAPNFAGAKARLQLCKRKTVAGVVTWVPVSTIGPDKTLGAASTAMWGYTPPAKGIYSLRVWFLGATRYGVDGVSTAAPLVPTIANASRVITLAVK
jgi:hypothetical protein